MKSTEEPKRLVARHGARRFVIEVDAPDVGWYLLVYDGERCTHDYLQDSLEVAKQQALEEFGVPGSLWVIDDVSEQ